MSILRQLSRGWRVLARRGAADDELKDELGHFYAEATADLVSRGMTVQEARREVRLQFGDPFNVVEEVRAHGWERFLDAARLDLRYTTRRLRRSPGFTAVCVLTLAVGIGASTAIFSAVKPILIDALPYDDAERIVLVADRAQDGSPLDVTFGTYRELEQRSRTFEAMAVFRTWQPTLTGIERPDLLEGQRVGARYFDVLRVRPALGRTFTDAEDQVYGPNVVMISHGLWERRFGGDRAIIGRTITLNENPFTVIGVLPPEFENVLQPAAVIWSPLQYDAALPADGREWGHHLRMVGRLTPSADLRAARHEMESIAQTPLPEFARMPWASMQGGMLVSSMRDELMRGVRAALLAVIGAVLLVLTIVCVNVASLLLVRGSERSAELSLRTALGAGRPRMLAQFVLETCCLALLGALVGLLVARLGIEALIALSPPELPRIAEVEIDSGVFAFAFGTATLIGLVVGWVAARHATLRAPAPSLHSASHRVAGGDQRWRRTLVVAQVALAVVLLVCGGLLLRSMQRLMATDPGFASAQVLTMQVQAVSRRYDDDGAAHRFFAEALDAVRVVPSVRTAAFTSQLPLSGDFQKYGVHLQAASALRSQEDGSGFRYAVTADYFAAMSIPLRSGRLLDDRDRVGAPNVVVINESLTRRRFAGTDPLGQRLRIGSEDQPWSTVVGVVGDVHQAALGLSGENAVYLPTTQSNFTDRTLWLVVRTNGDPGALAPVIRDAIWSVDAEQPITRVSAMHELVRRSAAQRRFILVIFDVFALTALLLAAVGLYGLLAAMVNAREREIGVRGALGATRGAILRMILGQGMTLTAFGLAIGIAAAAAATRGLRSLLFGISELDPVTFLGVLLVMTLACIAASLMPAVRATRVEPAIAIRENAT